MDAQLAVLAQNAIDAIKSIPFTILLGAAGSATWDANKAIWVWMKSKLTAPIHTQIIEQVEANPDNESKWGYVKLALEELLSENPELVGELKDMVTNARAPQSQVIKNTGEGSKNTQISGDGNTVIN